jgi:hypothetical protein
MAEQILQPRKGQAEIFAAFMVAALKSNSIAAKDSLMRHAVAIDACLWSPIAALGWI